MKEAIIGVLLGLAVGAGVFYYLYDKTVCDFELTSRDFQFCIDIDK